MTLEEALTKSTEAAEEARKVGSPFRPSAIIRENKKLPIIAYSKTDIEYSLKSDVGDVGYDCNFMFAKWKLRKRTDWEPVVWPVSKDEKA